MFDENENTSTRAVCVIDRGWIFAGDIEETHDGIGGYLLRNAVHVQSWSSVGFDGMIANPDSNNVNLKKMDNPVVVPHSSLILMVPVESKWGL